MWKRQLLFALLFVGAAFSLPLDNETISDGNSAFHPDDNLVLPESIPEEESVPLNTDVKTQTQNIPLPPPVEVSLSLGVSEDSSKTAQIQKVTIDEQGIPVIEGIRLPDDPNDKKIWRNARVINNILVENNATQDEGGMFIYRPNAGRSIASNDGFKPSQVDETFSSSLPYPAFYYQSYYNNKSDVKQLPDTVGTESFEESDLARENQTDARGIVRFGENHKQQSLEIPQQNVKVSSVDGRPVYFVSQDAAKSIHDDHSPFDFEPAQVSEPSVPSYSSGADDSYYQYQYQNQYQNQYQTQDRNQYQNQYKQPYQAANDRVQGPYQQQQQQSYYQGPYNQPSSFPASQNSFVIRDQVYKTGGATFQVPIPVPKDQYSTIQKYPYTYPGYPYQQQVPLNPIENLGNKLKQQVQKSKDKFHDLTSPVVDPIVEAGHKISYNLGIPERVNQFSEKVAQPQIAVPLALAGGAALALGALGAGVAIAGSNKTSLAKVTNLRLFKRSIDDLEEDDPTKTNVVDTIMSSLNAPQRSFLSELQKSGVDNWKETPCAKRIFCDVMIQQDDDAVNLMEKRMSTFLALLDSGIAENLQTLTTDVMDAIRRRDCSAFACGVQVKESAATPKSNGGPR